VIFVIAALITPPDIVSQIMVAIPMIALYELSIILCTACKKIWNGNKNKNIGKEGAI
jgi:Sec-independent protein secretion pathway component TatC